ncbi:MAG: hypothetical protein AAF616_03760 [Bacteroidota bacterium]
MKVYQIVVILLLSKSIHAQDKSIVSIIDDLTVKWDQGAINLKTYQGIQEFCLNAEYQAETIKLLDEIHHWDTSLYFIVQRKFDIEQDKEAAETLADIEKLETQYSTINFKSFIQDECSQLKVIASSFDQETVKKYEKEIRKFEKELVRYVNSITYRIDIIDEHVHHLALD